MKCKICEAQVLNFAKARLLNKYNVDYFQCQKCGFVQTEDPYWLEEAYSNPISRSDIGLARRNIVFSKLTSRVIVNIFNPCAKFLDYGCGYGLFVRIMRDLGFNFYGYDKFCDNIFSQDYAVKDIIHEHYDAVTAFEVFEHFVEPSKEIEQILKFSKNILFSTELLPSSNPKPGEWSYYVPHEGQHISIYTKKSLSVIAEKYNLNIYSNGLSIHLLTEKELPDDIANKLEFSRYEPSIMPRELSYTLLPESLDLETSTSLSRKNYLTADKNNLLVIIDGVFFQLYQTGIARVWKSLLEEWADDGFAEYLVVLDRAGTAPKIPGVRYRTAPAYDYSNTDADREMLQQICDEEGADLFISTYYTTPLSTPSVFIAHDMIPELLGWDLNHPMWREKHYGIRHACGYIAVSKNTAHDLAKCFPDIPLESITIAHNGVKANFSPTNSEEIKNFRIKYGILKPYFMLVGAGSGYKNSILFFKAFAQLCSKQGFDIVCTGSGSSLESEFRNYTSGCVVHMLQLSDYELIAAYSGAVALVYPSKYEGFGLPVLEAMACGCPVIACPNGPIPEVAGEAALYVYDADVDGLVNALCDVQKPAIRNSLMAGGIQQSKKFSWSKMARIMSSALIDATLLSLNLKEINLIIFPDWSQPEESLGIEVEGVFSAIASHPDKSKMTLLIDTSGISEDDANLTLSGVAMNMLMQENLDISEELEISLLGTLGEIQWEALLPRLKARIVLDNENQQAIAKVGTDSLPCWELAHLSEIHSLL
jgi:glycosyltransferase involved in cell wall biosynthesis